MRRLFFIIEKDTHVFDVLENDWLIICPFVHPNYHQCYLTCIPEDEIVKLDLSYTTAFQPIEGKKIKRETIEFAQHVADSSRERYKKLKALGINPATFSLTAPPLAATANALVCLEHTDVASCGTKALCANKNVVTENSIYALRYQDGKMTADRLGRINNKAAMRGHKATTAGYRIGTENSSAAARDRVKAGHGFGKRNTEKRLALNLRGNIKQLCTEYPDTFSIHEDNEGFTIGPSDSDQIHDLLIEKLYPADYEKTQHGSTPTKRKATHNLRQKTKSLLHVNFTLQRYVVKEGGKRVKIGERGRAPAAMCHYREYMCPEKQPFSP